MTDVSTVEGRLAEVERRIALLEDSVRGAPETRPSSSKRMSIREFLNLVSPTSDVERTLFLGHFLEKSEGVERFNVEDLRNAFSRAKEPRPANINDSVNKNIQRGFLMEADERKSGTKAWAVTNSGELFVTDRLSKSKGA